MLLSKLVLREIVGVDLLEPLQNFWVYLFDFIGVLGFSVFFKLLSFRGLFRFKLFFFVLKDKKPRQFSEGRNAWFSFGSNFGNSVPGRVGVFAVDMDVLYAAVIVDNLFFEFQHAIVGAHDNSERIEHGRRWVAKLEMDSYPAEFRKSHGKERILFDFFFFLIAILLLGLFLRLLLFLDRHGNCL